MIFAVSGEKCVLRKTEKWITFLENTKILEKREKGNDSIFFRQICVENHVISKFRKIFVPKKDQAVRGFQLRLLKTETKQEIKANLHARADMSRNEQCWALSAKLLGSVAFNIR